MRIQRWDGAGLMLECPDLVKEEPARIFKKSWLLGPSAWPDTYPRFQGSSDPFFDSLFWTAAGVSRTVWRTHAHC